MSDGAGIDAARSYTRALDELRERRRLEEAACIGWPNPALRHISITVLVDLLARCDELFSQYTAPHPSDAGLNELARDVRACLARLGNQEG